MTRQKSKLSGFKNAENELENAMYPRTVGFMTSQKFHHVFHDSAEIAFSGHQNAENELILKLSEVTLNSGLHDSAKIAFSCPRNAENELTRKYVPLNRCLTTRQK